MTHLYVVDWNDDRVYVDSAGQGMAIDLLY